MAKLPRRAVLTAGTAWVLTACSAQDSGPLASSSGSSTPATASSTTTSSPYEASSSPLSTNSEATGGVSSAKNLDHSTPTSLAVIVNKHHPMNPQNWAPDDLVGFGGKQLRAEAAEAAQKMFDGASAAGLPLIVLSGYRSYDTQVSTYNGWVAQQGQEMADVASARPGYSEHQTGLAFDVGTGTSCDLQPCFAQTQQAQWLAEHCTEYGFVLRFPWQQQDVTGYWFESWHFRYIGTDQAAEYKKVGASSLESFWGLENATDYQ